MQRPLRRRIPIQMILWTTPQNLTDFLARFCQNFSQERAKTNCGLNWLARPFLTQRVFHLCDEFGWPKKLPANRHPSLPKLMRRAKRTVRLNLWRHRSRSLCAIVRLGLKRNPFSSKLEGDHLFRDPLKTREQVVRETLRYQWPSSMPGSFHTRPFPANSFQRKAFLLDRDSRFSQHRDV